MHRHGQMSIFLIMAVLAITAISFILIQPRESKSIPGSPIDGLQAVKYEMSACLRSLAQDGLLVIGTQGGYYRSVPDPLQDIYFQVPIVIADGKTQNLPSTDSMSKELEVFIERNIPVCTKKLSAYGVRAGLLPEAKAKISIGKKVNVLLDYPLILTTPSSSSILSPVSVSIDADLEKALYVVLDSIDLQSSHQGMLPVGELGRYALENGISIELSEGRDGFISRLTFSDIRLPEPFTFQYGVKP